VTDVSYADRIGFDKVECTVGPDLQARIPGFDDCIRRQFSIAQAAIGRSSKASASEPSDNAIATNAINGRRVCNYEFLIR
jgi:hypothetical protein